MSLEHPTSIEDLLEPFPCKLTSWHILVVHFYLIVLTCTYPVETLLDGGAMSTFIFPLATIAQHPLPVSRCTSVHSSGGCHHFSITYCDTGHLHIKNCVATLDIFHAYNISTASVHPTAAHEAWLGYHS